MLKSEFSRNVLTLVTGTSLAQAIPIAITPILTRLYTPEDFGVLALFIAITSIIGSIANGRYELAIMLPKKDEDAINILALGFIIMSVLSIILFLIVLIFNSRIVQLLDNEQIGLWLYFVPITVFFIGLFNLLNFFNNRTKAYKDIAKATVFKSVFLAIVQLLLGLVRKGAVGLISGQIISHIAANLRLLKNIVSRKSLLSSINKVKIIELAKRYKKFPLYSMWGILLNTLSTHFTNILVSAFYSVSTLGMYSLVQKVLGAPITLISNSIGQVFFQQATQEKNETGKAVKSFNGAIKKLILLGLPLFSVLFLIVEPLFGLVFGKDWHIAGAYAKILLPLYFIRFVVSAVTNINNVFEQQRLALFWQFSLFTTAMSVFFASKALSLSFTQFIIILTIGLSVNYLVLFFILRRVSYRGALR